MGGLPVKTTKEKLINELSDLRQKVSGIEKELSEYKTYMDSIGEPLIVLDMQRRVTKLNKAALRVIRLHTKRSARLDI